MLPFNQRGVSQIVLPLFFLAAIALAVYLAQQPTELTPSAQQGTCTPSDISLSSPDSANTNKNVNPSSRKETVNGQTKAYIQSREQFIQPDQSFAIKFVWTDGRVSWDFKSLTGALKDGFAYSRDGKCTQVRKKDNDRATPPAGKDGYYVTEFADGTIEHNFFLKRDASAPYSDDNRVYDSRDSYSLSGSTTPTGSNNLNASCSNNNGSQCKSGVCSNSKCVQGSKKGTESCTNKEECESNTCTNGKCSGGALANGKACNDNSECASNKCGSDNKCVSATASASPSPKTSPKASSASSGSSGGSTGSGASTAPASSTAPAASGTSAAISLTKAEITGFRNSYNALAARLGTASNSGNLKVVSGIAGTELDSIVSQFPTCPDDANVGTCLDSKFRTRFDFAKTAARLTAFYAIFNNISGLCVKSDFGLNPLITATSSTGAIGRVNLCTEPTAAQKIWRIFTSGKFEPVLTTDTRWPTNPTCASLPADILTHYRNAETLFNTQVGFVQNTLCDGKTTVAPGGGI